MSAERIFISYRRADSGGWARSLHDNLEERLGPGRAFRDVAMQSGMDFHQHVESLLDRCDVLLAVIGKRWASITDADGNRRLDDPDDLVRGEISRALQRPDVQVIPVLVDGARMPSGHELPPDLAPLSRRHACELSDSRWEYDVETLTRRLRDLLGEKPPRRSRVKVWQVLVGLLGVVATVSGLLLFGGEKLRKPPPPRPLTGDLNMLVADFGVEDKDGHSKPSVEGHAVALSFYESLVARLRAQARTSGDREPLRFGTRGPSETGRVGGGDARARARSTAELARRHNADIVVYGNLRSRASGTSFLPEFYVTPRKLGGAEELAGPYRFGTPIEVPGRIEANPEASRALREQLLVRTRALADFTVGLGEFAAGRYASAVRRLGGVAGAPGWTDADGKAVVYLLLGNAELRLGRLSRAQAAYGRSLKVDPTYARAQFGLAEVQFQRACRGGGSPDASGLAGAVAGYRNVLDAPQQPDAFPMRVKTNLGIGKAELCFAPPRCASAARHLDAVVRDFRADGRRLPGETAEAWGGLGVALELCPSLGAAGRERRLRAIADRYRHAAELATLSTRRAYYWSEVGRIRTELRDEQGATRAYTRAIELEPSERLRADYRAAQAALASP